MYKNMLTYIVKKRLHAFGLILIVFFSSCEKFLDLKPTDSLLSENAVYDAKTSRALVNSAYTALKNYYRGSALILGTIPADNVLFGGSQSQNIELDNQAFTVTNSAIVQAYQSNYALINVTNWAISEIPKVQDAGFLAHEQNKLIGEAHFVRALAYFHLVRSWGGVQLQLQPTKDLKTLGQISRSSIAETYAQILSDLNRAEELLPADDASTRNVAQKAIVKAFRAKINLYAGHFDQVEIDASEVINNPKYSLLEDYTDFFKIPFLSKESVFEISATVNNAGVSASPWLPASGTPRGSYEYRPTQEIINLLQDPLIGGERAQLLASRGADTYVNLYHTVSPSINPVFALRISELYLTRAEARVRRSQPDLVGAIEDLNKIKSRASVALYPVGNLHTTQILDAIWKERRVEFAFEADRWYDLVRTEQAQIVLGVQPNFWLFPIPQTDVLGDPDLDHTNNPGY